VADHVVDGTADGLGEAVVADVGRGGLLHLDDVVMADAVQFVGGDAGLDVLGHDVQHFGRQLPGHAGLGDFCGVAQLHFLMLVCSVGAARCGGRSGDYFSRAGRRLPYRSPVMAIFRVRRVFPQPCWRALISKSMPTA
jgi:hypothetical protein